MKRTFLFLSLIFLLISFVGCTSKSGYKIDGEAKSKQFDNKTVYLKDAYNEGQVYDSAKVINGKFSFSDTINKIDEPYMRLLSIHTDKFGLDYRLPVVIENGNIKAEIGDIMCVSGTDLNDKLQDLLKGINDVSAKIILDKNCTEEQIKSRFENFLKETVNANSSNIVGLYIVNAYQTSFKRESLDSLLNENDWLKERFNK